MREKITAAIADADQRPQPPPTAKQLIKPRPDDTPTPEIAATVQLPDFEVTAPLIKNKQKIELDLAKSQVAMRQEQVRTKATETDKILNNDAFSVQVGPATFAFGSATASNRAMESRYRLGALEVEQTILLTGLTADEKEQKELMRLLSKAKGPTPW